ncbi:MAG: flagellar filament capping protein FliD [Gemmatimonadaceae bacterium]
MTAPIGSFQGLASGIQWRDLVDQIIQVETARALTPVSTALGAENRRIQGWDALTASLTKARDALTSLKDGAAFRSKSGTVNATTTGRAVATLGSIAAATPGRYSVEVDNLARSEKLTGLGVADSAAALGITGRFSINGRSVTIESTDSLARVRDKINAVNSGAAPSRVAATLSSANGATRLVLSAESTGARGVELADDRSGAGGTSTLESLGFVDSSRALNTGSDGKVRSMRLSSTTLAAAAALGISVSPSPATILVNGRTLTVDLENDSLAQIVARINALSPSAASIETETEGSTTWSRLAVSGAVAGDGSPGADLVMEALGLRVGGRASNVTQAVAFGAALTGFGGAVATGSTQLTDLGVGSAAGLQAGDVIALSATDGVGAAVTYTYTVSGTDTVDDLLDTLESAFAPGRDVTASIVNGQIRFTDSVSGDSRLAINLSAGLQSGGILDFGATTTTFGRIRQLTAGEDALIRVDGAVLTSRSNTVAGAVGGATLNLTGEEPGSPFEVTIAASRDSSVSTVTAFATAYNELVGAIAAETKAEGRLPFSSGARSVLGAMKGILLAEQVGLGATAAYTRASSVGLSLQKDGTLKLDATAFRSALERDPLAVEALFMSAGTASNASIQYVGSASVTPSSVSNLVVTRAATRSTALGTPFATYAAGPTPASMTVTSEGSGLSTTITLTNGDTPAILAARLSAAFAESRVAVAASVEGGALRLTSTDFGSLGGFTVSYTDPGAENPAAQLGIAAQSHDTGLDAAGSLDGEAMTGSGQLLTSLQGLVLRYTGADDNATSEVRYTRGLAGGLVVSADSVLNTDGGAASLQVQSARNRIATLEKREIDILARLDRRRATLVADFTRMETLLSQFQAQSAWLTSQVTSLNAISAGRAAS